MLAVERPRDAALFQAVDDVDFVDHLAILKYLQAGAFDNEIVLITFHQVPRPDPACELCLGILFGVLGVDLGSLTNRSFDHRMD